MTSQSTIATEPNWLNIDDLWLNRGAAFAPIYQLIEGKFIAIVNRRLDIPSAAMIGRAGLKAVLDTELTEGRFEWTHSEFLTKTGFPSVESLDDPANAVRAEKAVRNVARQIPLVFGEGDELMEGIFGCSNPYAPHFRWFYDERRIMYAEKGLDIRAFGTYGSWAVFNGDPWLFKLDGNTKRQPNDPVFKAMVADRESARRGVDYFNVLEPLGIGFFIKHYADQALYASRYYNKAFAAERMSLGTGKERGMWSEKGAYIDWPKIEGLPAEDVTFHHANFNIVRKTKNGEVHSPNQHPQIDYHFEVGNIFAIGLCRLGGYVGFDERVKHSTDPFSPNFPNTPIQWHDAGLHAGHYYNQCHRTAGKPWKYTRYRFKNSETWIEPKQDGTTILEHASAFDGAYAEHAGARRGRPDSMFRIDENALDVWGFDPSRSIVSPTESIIANPIGDVMVELNLRGSKLLLKNETI